MNKKANFILSERDLRWAYKLLLLDKKYGNKSHERDALKREIREFTHRESNMRLIWDEGFGLGTYLIQCPDYVKTKHDAEKWFFETEHKRYDNLRWIYKDYDNDDCEKYKLFIRNGKWMCYHYTYLRKEYEL